ncbi:MAG: hypothetical protein VCC00_02320 [Deltaproteobacteria bacterium]
MVEHFGNHNPTLDPTFLTAHSLEEPPSWMLEALRNGITVVFDPTNNFQAALDNVAERSDVTTVLADLLRVLKFIAAAFARDGAPPVI